MKKIKFNIRCGFTLAELLIAISLIGILAAITMPTLKDAMPDKYDAMRKKAEYELEQKVADIVNDDLLYGDTVDANGNTVHGLRNMYYVNYNGKAFGCDILENMEESKKEECKKYQKQKFCKLLAAKFDLAPGTAVNCEVNAKFKRDGGTPSFISRDGIEWLVPISDFSNADEKHYIAFKTSADGDLNAPRCATLYISSSSGVSEMTSFASLALNTWGWKGNKDNTGKTQYTVDTADMNPHHSCKIDYNTKQDVFIYTIDANGQLQNGQTRTDKIQTVR